MKTKLFTFLFLLCFFTAVAQVPSYVPTNGLVGYWSFSGNANDESGNGNNGTVNGATLTTDRYGNANSAYSFDGSTSKIKVTHNNSINAFPITISTWFKSQSNMGGMVSKYEGCSNNGWSIHSSNNKISGYYYNFSGGSYVNFDPNTSTININDNSWHQVVETYDASGGKIFIDGNLVSADTFSGAGTPSVCSTIADLYFGYRVPGNPAICVNYNYFFQGIIDDIGIWNRALTPQEVSNLYTQTTPVSCLPANVPTNGLVGYWPFCGNANDESGNGNNGTNNGATLTADRFGDSNSAYSFNGTTSRIDVTNAFFNVGWNQFTISCWMNTANANNSNNNNDSKPLINTDGHHGIAINTYGNNNPFSSTWDNKYIVLAGSNPAGSSWDVFGPTIPVSSNSVTLNTWNHIVLVKNSNIYNLYVNGLLDNTTYTGIVTPSSSLCKMVFGALATGISPEVFLGKLDDYGIWNRALTPQEVSALYNPCTTPPSAPIAAATQTFCSGTAITVANLSATGTGVQWYDAATGGNLLASTTTLTDGQTVYASQTENSCESTTRTAVTASINDPQITASATTVCAGTAVNLSASTTAAGLTANCTLPTNLQNGLVGYWPFCGNANDASGNGNNGTVNGATLTADRFGNTNNAYNFDGVSNYINLNTSFPSGSNSKSFVIWLKLINGSYNFIIDGGISQNSNSFGLFWTINAINNKLTFHGDGANFDYEFSNINFNLWNQVAITYDGVDVKAYLNGFYIGSKPISLNTSNSNVLVGCRNNYTAFFPGQLDDVGIWNRALTQSEISQLYGYATYLWSTGETTVTINPTPTETTTYWCDVTVNGTTCRKEVTITVNSTTPAPTASATQTFCAGTAITVANLSATGTGIQWYNAATGGNLLASTTTLTDGQTVYASQTENSCESTTRTAVTVSVNDPQITASATTVCAGTAVNLSASTTSASLTDNCTLPANLQNGLVGYWPFCGNANDASGNGNNGIVNGATLTTDRFGNANSAYSFDGNNFISTNIIPSNISQRSYSAWFKTTTGGAIIGSNSANNTSNLVLAIHTNGTSYGNEGTALWVVDSEGSSVGWMSSLPTNNLYNDNLWHNITGVFNSISGNIISPSNLSLYVDGVLITIIEQNVNPSISPINILNNIVFGYNKRWISNGYGVKFDGVLDDISIWNRVLSIAEITQLYNAGQTTYLWSTGETTATINPSPTATTTYWCDVTVNGTTCRKEVTITVNSATTAPTAAATQTFCAGTAITVANLTANGTGVNWYDAATGGNLLATTSALTDGQTVYASQTENACESTTRTGVTVSVNDPQIIASATTVCAGTTVNLTASTSALSTGFGNTLPTNLQNGLVGYWPFNGNANDASGNGNNGTVNGATLTTDRFGNSNGAYSFNGVNNNINLAPINYNGNNISISTWVNPTSITSNINHELIRQQSSVGLDYLLSFQEYGNIMSFGLTTSNNGYTELDVPILPSNNSNSWHNFIAVYNGNNRFLYEDGVLIGSDFVSGNIIFSSDKCSIGSASASFEEFFNGKIDELEIYNRALTPTEINQLYNSGQTTYLWSTGETTASINPSPTATTTYWCDVTVNGTTCRKEVTITVNSTTPAPTASATQTFCSGTAITVANLSATGTGVQWYDAATGGNLLASTSALTDGQTVYASQTENACESTTRTGVTVSVNDPQITASATTVCAGTAVNLSASTTAAGLTANCTLPANLQNGLVGYWPFCGNANDASGNGNNGTVNGATLTSDRFGYTGNAYNFDGLNSSIGCGNIPNALWGSSNNFSFNFWFNPDGNRFGRIFTFWPNSGDLTYAIQCTYEQNRVAFNFSRYTGMSNPPYVQVYPNYNFSLNTWQNVTLTYSGNVLKMYVNGILIDSASYSGPVANHGNNSVLRFGMHPIETSERYSGNLDDFSCYNKALTPLEISQLYNAGQTTYLWSTGETTATINPSPTATTTYWCDVTVNGTTCRKEVTITVNSTTTAPTASANQTFCAGTAITVSNLTATGTVVQWYDAATGGNLLASTTTLTDRQTVYASQTENACESTTRTAVTVSVNNPQITASATTVCAGTAVNLSASTTATGLTTNCTFPANLQNGLVGYWPFCGNANDASGNGNNGTVNGATLTTDRFGNANSAYSFDGVSNWIQVADNLELNPTTLTINAWVKPLGFNSLGASMIVNKGWDQSPGHYDLLLFSSNNKSRFVLGSNIFVETNSTVNLNDWIFLTASISGLNAKIYLNGVLENSTTLISNNNLGSSTSPLYFGKHDYNGAPYVFNGFIDDISIFNRDLTPTEITQLYNSGHTTYLWSTGETTATINPSPTATTTYWCDVTVNGTTCRKEVTITVNSSTPAPTASATQTFCAGTAITVANLTAFGTGVQWYDAATGGNLLASTSTLTDGQTVYASQTENACESTTRTAITVSVNDPQITASATTVCAGTAVNLSASTTSAGLTANCTLPANLQNGLVGYWPFCGNANDASGYGNNGTVNGATLTTDRFGNVNSAYSFDGVNDEISSNLSLLPINNDPRSVLSWIKTSASGLNINNSNPNLSTITAYGNSSAGNVIFTQFHNLNNNKAYFESGSSNNQLFSSNSINDGEWHLIVTTYDGSNVKLYLDGNLNATSNSLNLTTVYSEFGIGYCPWESIHFQGNIDEVSIFNRALSPTEITQLYNASQTTYLWSTGETTASINPSPTATTTYWCDVTINGTTCRKEVTITVNSTTPAPTASATQTFCAGTVITVANLTATGTGVQWYDAATGGNLLASSAALTDGQTVYASQTENSCESTTRTAVTVSVNDPQITASATTVCAGNMVNLSMSIINEIPQEISNFSGPYFFNNHTYFKSLNSTIWPNAIQTCNSLNGYLAIPNSLEECEFLSSIFNNSTTIHIGITDLQNEGVWLDVLGNPLIYTNWAPSEPNNEQNEDFGQMYSYNLWNDQQGGNFDVWPFVLEYNSQTTYLWSTGETTASINPIPTATTTYWCDVTVNGTTCRKEVTITVNSTTAAPTASATQTFCAGTAITVANLSATGTGVQWYDAATGGNLLASTTTLTDGQTVYASQTENACESTTRTAVTVSINDPQITASANTVCAGTALSIDIINVTPTLAQFQNSNPDLILFHSIGNHAYFYKNQAVSWPQAKAYGDQIGAPLYVINDSTEELSVYNSLPLHSNSGYNYWIGLYQDITSANYSEPSGGWKWIDNSPLNYTNWYTGEPNNNENGESYGQFDWSSTGIKWNDAGNANNNNTCACDISYPIYEFNYQPSYLWSTGETTATINPSPTATTTYWCDVTVNGTTCRKEVTITVNSTTPAPTASATQTFCAGTAITVANLTATGTGVQWYDAATGGNLLASTSALTDGQTVYASQTENSCESTTRTAVIVTINDPQITASATTVCAGTAVNLSASSTAVGLTANCTLPANLQNGLVGYWPFCGNANDASGNGNNGTVNGATLTTDRFGNANSAYSFDGLDDLIQCTSGGPSGNPNLSVSFWIKTSSNLYGHLIGYGNNAASGQDLRIFINGNCPNSIAFDTYDNQKAKTTTFNNTWDFYEITYDGSIGNDTTVSNFYKNGVLMSSECFNVNISQTNIASIIPLTFGRYHGTAQSAYYNGILDDITIYNRVLSTAEITQLYNAGQISYLWSTGETTATINPSPTATTTYWCDVTVNGATCRKEITITVNSTTPAPTAAATQTFCAGTAITVANLIATGTGVQWYDAATGGNLLASTTALTDGQTVYASQTENSCESTTRTAVTVTVNDPQITATATTVCSGTSVNLSVGSTNSSLTQFQNAHPELTLFHTIGDHGYFYKNQFETWQQSKAFGDQIGISLYVINDAVEELSVYNSLPNIGNDGIQYWIGLYQDLTSPNYSEPSGGWKWVDNSPLLYTNWYTSEPSNGQNGESFGQFDWDIIGIKWNDSGNITNNNGCACDLAYPIYEFQNQANYLWSTGETTDTINPSPTATTTYWCDVTVNGVTCRKEVTITVNSTTPAPTASATQTFCSGTPITVANLTATGTGVQWYDATTGGNLLASTAALTDGQTVYASQTENNCESTTRTAVTVTVNDPQITATATTVCAGTAVNLSASTTATGLTTNCTLPANLQNGLVGYWPFCGNANDVSGNGYNGTVNGATLTTDRFGNTDSAYIFDGVNDLIGMNNAIISPAAFTLSGWYNTPAIQEQSIFYQGGQEFHFGEFAASNNLMAGVKCPNLTWYFTNQVTIYPELNQWTHFSVSFVQGGELKLYLNGNLVDSSSIVPCSNFYIPGYYSALGSYNGSSRWFLGKLDDIAIFNRALSPTEITQLYNSSQTTYLWSTGETTATINTSPNATTTYWCDVTVNGTTCRKEVTITVNSTTPAPTAAATQTFCAGTAITVANLSATGTGVQWYDAATGGNLLANTTALTDGQTVYASQTENACESTSRTAVSISVNDPQITASATTVCAGNTVSLSASTTVAGLTANCTLPANLQNGLVGYWPFCGNANDASGNGNNGTVNGATLTTDRFGNANSAYSFDGVNNYIELPNQLYNGQSNSEYSISAWFNKSVQNDGILWAKSGFWKEVVLSINSNNQPGFFYAYPQPQGYFGIPNYSSVNLNSWNNITIVQKNSVLYTYVNNVLLGTSPANSLVDWSQDSVGCSTGNNFIGMGRYCQESYYLPFNGKIDELTFWNRAITQEDIQQLNNGSSYLWSTGETTATINPSPTATTTYWCDVTVNGVTCRKEVTITVNPQETPLFTQIAPICAGTTLTDLPTTSNNGITGTWSPALNNTTTTQYTFTPTAGLCATMATMTITVNPNVTPSFTQVVPICSGATLVALPTTSDNGITGTWSPALNNSATTLYTFTPTAGLCATTRTMTIEVNPNIIPTFTQVAPICAGETLAELPTTSDNGITGSWSPALNNTATTQYTFSPTAGLCVTTATMTITVNPNVTPSFTQVAPICSGATLVALPTTSDNGISGTWSPVLNNAATTLYTFTPNAGLCATTTTMTIEVNPNIIPTFTQVAPICAGETLAELPTTSDNGITGSWSPALNNTATTQYTFTPTAGLCATTATMTITVNPNVTPLFTQVAPICSGATLVALPTTSDNGITGTWSPTLNNTATTQYTFTPTAGLCATTTTITITVNPNVTSSFTQVAPICSGATLVALPTTSNNGISGTWSPALNNTATTLYTFTPTAGLCATTTTMTIEVNPNIVPTFTQVAPICSGATLAALPTTSNNGITGTWSPALNNSATTLYTFTPTAGLCATTATMTITVNPNVTPLFTQVNPICSGTTLAALPITSDNGITGTWSPALNNSATTLYTFTPTAGLCTTTATMTITVNPNVTPLFTQVAPICSGTTLAALPTTSNNGITGTWSPTLNNSATTLYTFTPTAGLCATTATMTITVNPNVTPSFTQVAPICAGETLAELPTTSDNGITGSWSPALNNTTTTQYTFTPTVGLCATTTTMTITVNPNVTPLFTQVAPICSGTTFAALPTTSDNGITGTWSPALNNSATTLYTFTPTAGLCATTATMTITVNPNVTPLFTQVAPICSGATLVALPTTSDNGITGTWSPALNNSATTLYTFTPTAGLCATTATMTITVNPNVTPLFTQVAPICSGATLVALPTTSNNGISGTWSPALNNTATTLYTFTPTAGLCATTTTMTIEVNPNIVPTFTQVAPICAGGTLVTLPTTSTNGINGIWSPALDNTTTTSYTFTPNAGQCATVANITITVRSLPQGPTGDANQIFCASTRPSVGDIVLNVPNLTWYISPTGTVTVPLNTSLVNGAVYYAAVYDVVTGCESNSRFMVNVTVNDEELNVDIPDQTFCNSEIFTIADIRTNGTSIYWYANPTGGDQLPLNTLLYDGDVIYATNYSAVSGCESSERQKVEINFVPCEIEINNLITLDGNDLNDNLNITNIENFENNNIEIFNRYGQLVWSTDTYNNTNNTFKGRANVSGVYRVDENLPTGVYFYILRYKKLYQNDYKEIKGYLYISNNQ